MPDAVVIGANGFLGSHLVDELARSGRSVRAFDRFSSDPVYTATGVEAVRGDFLSRSDLGSAVADCRSVFHFLSTTTPATAEADPTFDLRTNVSQTLDLLGICAAAGVDRLYYASTGGAIYGDQGRPVYAESDPALPVSPYGIGKLTVERYLEYFRKTKGLESVALRISNPYGPRQRATHGQGLIATALREASAGRPVVRYGDGEMVRDYLYVADLTRMIRRMLDAIETDREAVDPVYNLGSGRGTTVNDVLGALGRALGQEVLTVERPVPATFVRRVVLDTARWTARFGPIDLTGLDAGIRATLDSTGGPR